MNKTVKVKSKNLPQSPQKLRLVADMIRGMKADKALDTLHLLNKKGSLLVGNALKSAVSSADQLYQAEPSKLVVSSISVDEAPFMKKARFASRGRMARITKRRAHLNLELTVIE